MSIQDTDASAAAVAKGPRVSLLDIERNIAHRIEFNAGELPNIPDEATSLDVLSICILVTRSGFTVIGKSAPAAEENYDRDLGKRLAYEDAFRQLWPLMGYALKDRLWGGE